MLDSDTKRRINTCRDILVGKVPDPKSQVEQITIALIYKFMDDMDLEAEEMGFERKFFTGDFERYRWSKLLATGVSGQEMLNLYSEALVKMVENVKLPELFRNIFRNAYLPYRDPETLRSFLREVDGFTYDHSERLGDAFEYLLSVLGSQGDAGQFRTPRHIIDFMVEIIDPKKDEVVLDPACGTAGFLISSYKHVLRANSTAQDGNGRSGVEVDASEATLDSPLRYSGDLLTTDDRERLANNIKGYDISPDMVRLSLVNLYLHGFLDPKVEEYDTLTSEDKWGDTADVVLANPPFMSPKGGIRPHNRFQVQSKRSEVLFVDYMAEHLNPRGRAAIVVPEGIIFQSQSAYCELRRMLVEGKYLAAVISLPAGVFNPYSGVKTSILILDRVAAKACDSIAFFKIDNDGFGLGAQRRAVKGSQLPEVKAALGSWLADARGGGDAVIDSPLGFAVAKAQLSQGGEYNLSAERYRAAVQRPSDWPFLKVEDVFTKSGETVLPETLDGPTTYIGLENISSDLGTLTGETLVGNPTEIKSLKNCFRSGDILYGKLRPNLNKVWLADREGICSTDIFVMRANPAQVDAGLYAHLFRQSHFNRLVMAEIQGAQLPRVGWQSFGAIEIPVPPLEVQREILAEIESYQRVIDGARAVIENYRPRIMIDPEWPSQTLGELCDLYQPKTITQADLIEEGPYLVFGANGVIGRYDQYNHEDAEVLITCRGATCGTINMSEPRSWVTGNAMVATPKTEALDKRYLHAILLASDLSPTISGSAQPQITRQGLAPFKIPLPPIEIQETIVSELEAERVLVHGNRELTMRFAKKIESIVANVWANEAIPEEAVA